MEIDIVILKEQERECGFRHSGPDGVGLYLMGPGRFDACERLPFPLSRCPSCGGGIKFSRGYTWIEPSKLFNPYIVPRCANVIPQHEHGICCMCSPAMHRQGLLWIGEKYYTVAEFVQEAHTMGVSRRIAAIPRRFEFGRNVIYLAHRHAVQDEGAKLPKVFMVFTPTHVDIVVDTTDSSQLPPKALHLAEKYGKSARVVKVERVAQQENLFCGHESDVFDRASREGS